MATTGTRVYGKAPHELLAGEYGRWDLKTDGGGDGNFYAVPPETDLTANLASHTLIEHENGAITVTPSILVQRGRGESWHGYLTNGEWKKC
jgi:hypothetical protein